MTLVKENLIQSLCDQAGFSKHQSRTMVETVFELVKKSLESGDGVLISGFGKFYVREKPCDRRGFDPGRQEGGYVQEFRGFEEEA